MTIQKWNNFVLIPSTSSLHLTNTALLSSKNAERSHVSQRDNSLSAATSLEKIIFLAIGTLYSRISKAIQVALPLAPQPSTEKQATTDSCRWQGPDQLHVQKFLKKPQPSPQRQHDSRQSRRGQVPAWAVFLLHFHAGRQVTATAPSPGYLPCSVHRALFCSQY